jgi:hypothetical protein
MAKEKAIEFGKQQATALLLQMFTVPPPAKAVLPPWEGFGIPSSPGAAAAGSSAHSSASSHKAPAASSSSSGQSGKQSTSDGGSATPPVAGSGSAKSPGTTGLPIREGGLLGGDQAEIRQGDPYCAASENRNQYQAGLCPDTPPYAGWTDPKTGITYSSDNWFTEQMYHDGEDCYRGSGGEALANIHQNYDQMTREFHAANGYDPANLAPGVHCCYDDDGRPGQTSSFDFSGQAPSLSHYKLDVEPHGECNDTGEYIQYPTSGYPAPPRPSASYAPSAGPPYLNPQDIPPGHRDDPFRPGSLHPGAHAPGQTTWDQYGRPTQH